MVYHIYYISYFKVETHEQHNYVDLKTPIHVITGAAGNRENIDHFLPDKPDWSAFRAPTYSFTHATVSKEQIKFNQIDLNNNIIDAFSGFYPIFFNPYEPEEKIHRGRRGHI